MTIDGHYKGSRRIHNKGNKDANEKSIKRMIQEEVDREMVELRIQLNYIGQFLHIKIEENQRQGWNVRKRFKWLVMQLFARKPRRILEILNCRLSDLLKKQKLIGVEFKDKPLAKEEVHFFEQEKGDILGEDDGEKHETLTASLMNYLDSSYQHINVMTKGLREAEKPNVFKTDNFVFFTGFAGVG